MSSWLILSPSSRVRRLWLTELTGSPQLKPHRLLADALGLMKVSETIDLAGPFLGAPSAAVYLESKAECLDVQVVLIGVVGALTSGTQGLKIGDIVFPRECLIMDDGVSRLLGEDTARFQLSVIQEKFEPRVREMQAHSSVQIIEADVWTTDMPSQETPERVQKHFERGVRVVDMEYSAVSRICRKQGHSLLSAFVVSDRIGDHVERGYGSPLVLDSLTSLVQVATGLML